MSGNREVGEVIKVKVVNESARQVEELRKKEGWGSRAVGGNDKRGVGEVKALENKRE